MQGSSEAPASPRHQHHGHSPRSGQVEERVFVDCVSGRHASTSLDLLLNTRRLVWRKEYGWTYDAWVQTPGQYALSGAHSRFSLPGIWQGLGKQISGIKAAAGAALSQLQHRTARDIQRSELVESGSSNSG